MKRDWTVRLFDEVSCAVKIDSIRVETVVRAVLGYAFEAGRLMPSGVVEVSLIDRSAIAEINKAYRGKDYSTDVISFAYFADCDPPEVDENVQHLTGWSFQSESDELVIGEILICPEVAETQADQYGNNYSQELLRLLIHGTLHVCGYEHEGVPKAVEQEMQVAEDFLFMNLSNLWSNGGRY